MMAADHSALESETSHCPWPIAGPVPQYREAVAVRIESANAGSVVLPCATVPACGELSTARSFKFI